MGGDQGGHRVHVVRIGPERVLASQQEKTGLGGG